MSETLSEAIKALESAISELNEYSKSRDPMLLMDAAEKGWLAVSKAVKTLLKPEVLTPGRIGRGGMPWQGSALTILGIGTRLGRSSYTLTASTMVYAMRTS